MRDKLYACTVCNTVKAYRRFGQSEGEQCNVCGCRELRKLNI